MRLLGEMALYLGRVLFALLLLVLISGSGLQLEGTRAEVRHHTRPFEFDFTQWTLDALTVKIGEYGLNSAGYLRPADREAIVRQFLDLQTQEAQLENELLELYGQPDLEDRATKIADKTAELQRVEQERRSLQATAEAIVQQQVGLTLAEAGFNLGGKNFPPVAFHFTELPYALIVSPRAEIRQEANIQLETDLDLNQRISLEQVVEEDLADFSALVVPVGGYGTYPTMIQQTGSLLWVTEVVVHEWIHNYLTLRPLGLRYETSPELRTMNETAASLLGRTWGRMVLERYYPDQLPAEVPVEGEALEPSEPQPPAFDFREEMRQTRERVDQLLAEGEIEQAEAYMEARRLVFWENGYRIRRLNQAYFAFHGSYAAEPGGAAGDDPIGEAVRDLWAQIDDPSVFLRRMAWMFGPEDLETALGRPIIGE